MRAPIAVSHTFFKKILFKNFLVFWEAECRLQPRRNPEIKEEVRRVRGAKQKTRSSLGASGTGMEEPVCVHV